MDVVTHHVPQEGGFPAEMTWTAPLVARYITNEVEFSVREPGEICTRLCAILRFRPRLSTTRRVRRLSEQQVALVERTAYDCPRRTL